MASALTNYNQYMDKFDAETKSKARSAAFLTANLAKHLPTIGLLDRRTPKADAPDAFTDEHSYEEAWRASDRAAQQAEWNDNTDWRTR
jgi:hypothetical protein